MDFQFGGKENERNLYINYFKFLLFSSKEELPKHSQPQIYIPV